jgi:hypothetical protein
LTIWAAAALACLLGAVFPVADGGEIGKWREVLDLVRVASTVALTLALLFGPGLLWRAAGERKIRLAVLPLPGLGLLILTGGLAWALGGEVDPRVVCFAVSAPTLGLILGALIGAGPEDFFDREEQWTLLVVGLALGVAVGRSLWSLSTGGELFEGTISRNLVAEGRPDSRISYFLPQLIANHSHPYSNESNYLFAPYNFSSRGPLPGMAATPIVMVTGGRPPLAPPDMLWRPFDPEGFMAFRLAMITFSCTALLAVWEIVQKLGGRRAARFAVLLGVSTPFVIADMWFTWPKLLAAAFVLLGGLYIIERRSLRSGLLVGGGYLMHPSALLAVSGVGLLSLWPPDKRPRWLRPDLKTAFLFVAGVAVSVVAWRLVNGSHYIQEGFYEYVTQAFPEYHPSIGEWIHFRLASLANTLIPLFLPIFYGDNTSINTFGGLSPGVVHYTFQYWTGVPFGFGIVFFPFLLASLWAAFRRWTWGVTATIVIPFAIFAIYWGGGPITGLLREGLQAWVLTVIIVVALQQGAAGLPWLRSRFIKGVLSLRALEVVVATMAPVLGTHDLEAFGNDFTLNDVVALGLILGCTGAMAVLVWLLPGGSADAPAERDRDRLVAAGGSRSGAPQAG